MDDGAIQDNLEVAVSDGGRDKFVRTHPRRFELFQPAMVDELLIAYLAVPETRSDQMGGVTSPKGVMDRIPPLRGRLGRLDRKGDRKGLHVTDHEHATIRRPDSTLITSVVDKDKRLGMGGNLEAGLF